MPVDQKDALDESLDSRSIITTGVRGDKIKEGDRCWCSLPIHILELIALKLLGAAATNFSATCRYWRQITPYFPPPPNSALSPLPYLMSSNPNFYQPLNNVTYHKEIPQLKGAWVRHSAWGWLLLSRGYTTQFFFNPSNNQVIPLPDVPWHPRVELIVDECFTHPPTSSHCAVIIFLLGGLGTTKVGIIRCGQGSWTMYEFENVKDFHISNAGVVVNSNKLYCLGDAGNIGQLDLGGDEQNISWNICSEPLFAWPCPELVHMYAAKCDGGMLAVFVVNEERHVDVRRCKLPEMVWEDVKSLKNEAVYVSHGGCFVVKTPDEWMANKIYFPMFYGKSGAFYSLQTQKYHSIVGNYSSTTRINFLTTTTSYWIKVSHEPLLSGGSRNHFSSSINGVLPTT